VILRRKFVIYAIALMMLFAIPLLEGCNCGQVKDTPDETPMAQEQPEEQAQVEEFTPEPEPAPAPAPEPEPAPAPTFDISDIVDVFYAFDKSELTQASRDTLAQNAKLLKAAGNVKIVIEGHCDERGTNEYNLGLGERRANAAKDYLVSLGVSASSIKTISYGEEKPFAMGHDESAWKQNRRAHFGLQ
jgi:peptidoglycan-associated lipoprotein